MIKRIISNGYINRHHALILTFTNASDGRIKPVGVIKPMIPIPNRYAFTISLPGTFTNTANAPMIGMVNTAIPDEEEMNKVNNMYKASIKIMNSTGGILPASCAE